MTGQFTKMRSGDWGVRLDETGLTRAAGDIVTVMRRDGQTRQVMLGRQVTARVDYTVYEIANNKAEAPRQADCATTRRTGITQPGVYEMPDGKIYVVKFNRPQTRLYAKRLVEIAGDRLTEAGTTASIEFEYEAGAIFRLAPEMKMPLERAKQLTIRYGRCIVCGRHLKAAESVERGIGPVCVKSFA